MTGSKYKRTSAAVLIVALAALTLPLLYPLLSRTAPFTQCASLTLFRNPCPMCGLTRGFFHIWHLDFAEATRLNILSVPLFFFVILQACFRAWVLVKAGETTIKRIARPDMRIHALLVAGYFVYAVGFIALRWKFTL